MHKRRVDVCEVATSIRTAKAPHARVGGWRGVDRQQMQNATAERAHDVGQFSDDIAERAARRNDRVAFLIEVSNILVLIEPSCGACGFVRTEHARETTVNGICATRIIGMHGKARVIAFGPILVAIAIDHVCLGLEPPDFRQGKLDTPFIPRKAHRHIAPCSFNLHFRLADFMDDFATQSRSPTYVGAKEYLAVSACSS